MRGTRFVAVLTVAMLLAGAGCGVPLTTREQGALGGALVGAGAGALIGRATHHAAWKGAAIGGGAGLLGGALIGDRLEQRRRARYDDGY